MSFKVFSHAVIQMHIPKNNRSITFCLRKLGLSSVSDDNEDRASDLRVFLESLDSHHSEISGRDIFLSYYSEWSSSASVIEALKVLELRGRYNLMRG